jgi:hypothetical protein
VDPLVQAACPELAHECRVPIGPEGVAVTEAVTRQAVAHNHGDVGLHLGGVVI